MNEFEESQLEPELRALAPAQPPRRTVNAILEDLTSMKIGGAAAWHEHLGWLIPIAGMAGIGGLLLVMPDFVRPTQTQSLVGAKDRPLKADQVEIQHQLVANYDVLDRLPGGEPVRFHCAQWMDTVQVRALTGGVVIERTTPRLEIIPIGLETY